MGRLTRVLCLSLMVVVSIVSGSAAAAMSKRPPMVLGERISLDLKGVDIIDVLKLLSQKGGINFVAGRNVSGRVTIFAKDVEVWEAFERIVSANDLAYEVNGDMVNVIAARDYELSYGRKFQEPTETKVIPLKYAKVLQVATVLNQIKSTVGKVVADEASNTLIVSDLPDRIKDIEGMLKELDRETQTKVFEVDYSDVEKLQDKVLEMLTPIGVFSHDVRTNKILITDLPEVVSRVSEMLVAFDTPDPQVSIDARILSVQLSNDLSLGIDWQNVLSGIDAQSRTSFRVLSDIIGDTATQKGAALSLITSPVSDTTLVIEALRTKGDTRTLSNPRIMVSNNEEAKILVGTKQAVVSVTTTVPSTGTVVTSPEIQYVDVGTKLFVTPTVKTDGNVMLKVRPEVSTAVIETFADNRIPIVTTTEAETNVLIQTGKTLIIGGLISESKSKTRTMFPGLGEIPIIGWPFRGVSDTFAKTELVVFLTPDVIEPNGDVRTMADFDREQMSTEEEIHRNPVPASYGELIRDVLQEHIYTEFYETGLGMGAVDLSFVIGSNGKLLSVDDISSPDGDSYVQAARIALAEAQPFPSFPQDALAKEVRFRIAVDYEPQENP